MAKDFRKIPPNRLHWYAGLDADATLRLALQQRATTPPEFERTWRTVYGPATWALGHIERWGGLLSEARVRAYDAKLSDRIEGMRAGLVRHSPKFAEFNPRSPDQLKDLVFGQLGLRTKGRAKKTKTGNLSLSADVLQELVTERWKVPFSLSTGLPDMDPDLLAEKRRGDRDLDVVLTTMELKDALGQRSKYGVDYLRHVGYDGRVHTTYKMARTLRLISADPNLQNLTSPDDDLPPEEDPGVAARGIYVPPSDYVILSLDYSQIELRVAAWLSGDEVMARAFEEGDFHTNTARGIFGKGPDEAVAKGERRIAKNTNFGIAFNQGAHGLALKLGCTEDRAQSYIDGLLNVYKDFATWRRERVREVTTTGQVCSAAGAWTVRRRLPDVGETAEGKWADKMRKHAHNQAINTPIQATANLVCLESMYRVVSWLRENPKVPAELNMNVHDALVMYVREDAWEDVAHKVRDMMLDHETGCVKLKVDVEIGREHYGAMEKVDLR